MDWIDPDFANNISITQAKERLWQSVRNGELEMEANYPEENPLNDNSRLMVHAYKNQFGEAWLGLITLRKEVPTAVLWKWDGEETVLNFSCSFVVPRYDEELERLILARFNTPYEGTRLDSILVDGIIDRIVELGGHLLHWN